MNREPRTHAHTTVNRDQGGHIRYIVVRAEYFLEDSDAEENDPEKYTKGVSAKFRFDLAQDVDGDMVAAVDSVKDIEDGASGGYETNLDFIRVIPIAEDAVMNVPGVDGVQSTEAHIMDLLDKGRTAI